MNCCRQTSLDWQLQGGMSRRVAGPGMNFSSRISSVGLAESDGGVPTYHSPLSQTYTAVDFEMQARLVCWFLCFQFFMTVALSQKRELIQALRGRGVVKQ